MALLRCCVDRIFLLNILTRSHHPSSTPLDLASMPFQFPLEPLHLVVVVVEVVALVLVIDGLCVSMGRTCRRWLDASFLGGMCFRWAVRVVVGRYLSSMGVHVASFTGVITPWFVSTHGGWA